MAESDNANLKLDSNEQYTFDTYKIQITLSLHDLKLLELFLLRNRDVQLSMHLFLSGGAGSRFNTESRQKMRQMFGLDTPQFHKRMEALISSFQKANDMVSEAVQQQQQQEPQS